MYSLCRRGVFLFAIFCLYSTCVDATYKGAFQCSVTAGDGQPGDESTKEPSWEKTTNGQLTTTIFPTGATVAATTTDDIIQTGKTPTREDATSGQLTTTTVSTTATAATATTGDVIPTGNTPTWEEATSGQLTTTTVSTTATASTTTATTGDDIPTDCVYSECGDTGYCAYDVSYTWTAAKEKCESLIGSWHMVYIDDTNENNCIHDIIGTSLNSWIWIGANDMETEGRWMYGMDAITYNNWISGGLDGGDIENCACMIPEGGWRDCHCGSSHKMICEKP